MTNIIRYIVTIIFVFTYIFAGTIRGKVTLGTEKSVIAGVSIHLIDKKLRFGTDANGEFVIPNLTNGTYKIEILQLGYKRQTIENIVVKDRGVTEINVTLDESPFLLNEVVVTGSLNKHLLKDSPVITEIVSQKEIERTGSSDLSEVLKAQTGIELGTSIGQTQNARLQGLNKNHVLILVDGERLTGKVDDAVDLGQIPVNTIEKIEIVKGPLSATYGSEAIGGVINIITKNPNNSPLVHLSATGGNNGRQDYEISTSHSFSDIFWNENNIGFLINVGWNKYFGISHFDTSHSYDGLPEYDRKNVDLKIGMAGSKNLQMDVKAGYYEDYMIWMGSNNDFYETQTKATNIKKSISTSVNYFVSESSNLKLTGHYSTNDHGSVKITNLNTRFDNNLATEEIQTYRGLYSLVPYKSSLITMGAERNVEGSKSGRLKFGARSITNDVAYIEDEWSFYDYTLSFGGRYSDNSSFGSFFAPRLSMRYKLTDKLTLRGSYGRGYRAPSFIELFFDFNHSSQGYTVEGDPSLKPETSHGFNFGIDYARDDLIWFRANVYYNTVRNLIEDYEKQSASSANPITVFSYKNIAQAVTQGADVDIDFQPFSAFTFSLGYNYTKGEDGNGNELLFRIPHSVTLKSAFESNETGTTIILRGRWNDKMLVDDKQQNLNTLNGTVVVTKSYSPAYAVVDTKISQKLINNFICSGGINNIFNRTVYPYGIKKGREFFAGIQFQI